MVKEETQSSRKYGAYSTCEAYFVLDIRRNELEGHLQQQRGSRRSLQVTKKKNKKSDLQGIYETRQAEA